MTYDLTNDFHRKAFLARVDGFLDKGAVVDLTEKTFRTRSQNSYLHLLIGVVAMETGNTLAYTKEMYFKRLVNPDIFIVRRKDRWLGEIEIIRSTASLTKEESSMAIDRFKRWGADNSIYMPSPGDESLIRQISVEMARMQNVLY